MHTIIYTSIHGVVEVDKKREKEKYEIIGPLLNWVFIALFIRQRENIGEIFYCDKCGIILLSKMVIDRVYVNVIEQFEIK